MRVRGVRRLELSLVVLATYNHINHKAIHHRNPLLCRRRYEFGEVLREFAHSEPPPSSVEMHQGICNCGALVDVLDPVQSCCTL
ncbi:hypothetical protein CEP54_000078 [Fusarium duplospermum]|uniref:Uncharacterized protein n=1 Tax=Fusarium duplospermum TaxID=1325734 RepID=A0A428R7W7_9HYPO|nr:hypothetical protein CEP54_000078 [Fusarium duplospermum]